jgi:hypothetical protein
VSILNRAADLVLVPAALAPPLAGLSILALLTSAVMLWVVRLTSNQPAINAVKRQMLASVFEIRLFNDDPGAIARAQIDILRRNLTYLRLSAVPLAWMLVPLVFAAAQLECYYGYTGVEPRRPTLVTAAVDGVGRPAATLDLPTHLRTLEPGVWLPASREMAWRVVADEPGAYEVKLNVAGVMLTKTLIAGDRVERRSPVRGGGWLSRLAYPSEAPLPDGPVRELRVSYPRRYLDVWGWELHWSVVYLLGAVAFALALKKPFGVTL